MKHVETAWPWVCAFAVGTFAALIGAGYCALILAEFGVFRLLPCMVFAVVVGAMTGTITLKRCMSQFRREIAGWLVAGVIAFGSLAMTIPPSEMILGGWDPGVYVHTAAAIARGGSLQIKADDLARLSEEDRGVLHRDVGGIWQPFLGMFLLPNGKLSPQFMHLYPSLLAVGYSVFGVWGALLVNPVLNIIAILLIYRLATQVVGRTWALAAPLLLAINPVQAWQAQFSTSEMLEQVLLLAGFSTLLAFAGKPTGVMMSTLSGTLFGMAFLARYDAVLIVLPVVLLVIVLYGDPEVRRGTMGFLLAISLLGLHAWLHMRFVAPCYRPLPDLVFPVLTISLALAVLLFAALHCPPVRKSIAYIVARSRLLQSAFSCSFIFFLVFAWYVRPHLTVDGRVLNVVTAALEAIGKLQWLDALRGPNALNVYYLKSILGTFGLLLGCAGVLVLVWRSPGGGTATWLVASTCVMMVLVTDVFHDHFMMWVSRRFVPVVIPLLTIGIAASVREIHIHISRICTPLARPLATGIVALVVALLSTKAWAVASSRDWPGLIAWYQNLTRMIPQDAVVCCDQAGFAAPLRFLYGIRSYEVYGGKTCGEYVRDHRLELSRSSDPICVLTMRGQPLLLPGIELQELGRMTLVSQIQNQPKYSIPKGVKGRGGHFVLYRVGFACESSAGDRHSALRSLQ